MAPMQRQLRKALGVVKDQTSIGLAKVGSTGAPDLDVALVKATSHEEVPIPEKYVQEIIHLTSYSRAYVGACVAGVARRLGKTHNWIVALKALMLIHRLLRDGSYTFEQELLFAGRRGMQVLNLSDFRDDSHSHAWDYSAFVRTYALFLDERLDSSFGGKPLQLESRSSYDERRSGHDDYGSSSYNDYGSGRGPDDPKREELQQSQKSRVSKDMKAEELLAKVPVQQRLLDRVLACRPTGAAKINRLVQIALYPIVRESFQIYSDVCDGLTILLDAFFGMDHQDCIRAFDIYSRGAKQVDELASFYSFCKNLGVCRPAEYPVVQKITEDLLETLEDYLRNRADTSSRLRSQKSSELKPRSPEPEQEAEDVASYEVNGMKALPAPPIESSKSEPDALLTEKRDSEADLLNLDQATISSEEHGDRLALALFSGSEANGTMQGSSEATSGESGAAGWELALVASASQLSKFNSNTMAGGFDRLLLDGMYDQAVAHQKFSATVPAGSASSVATLPGRSSSAVLALPAPVAQVGEDPFAASANIPPPSYVQMADLRGKQQLVVEEQQLWLQYQRDGMQGYNGLMKCYNNINYSPLRTAYAVPYYGMGSYASY